MTEETKKEREEREEKLERNVWNKPGIYLQYTRVDPKEQVA